MEDTVLYRDPTEVFNPLESEKVSNVSSLSAFLATLNQSGSGGSRLRRFLDETGSLDVNVGDSNSCRLSDISSISYTNVTQDDNESLGCETNASLDNIIDSASSCRSDEESPYELDQDDTDYGLESSGYFGNQDLFSEKPLKVDKSSMTNLAPSDDDIKNFMSPHDSIADLNSGLSAEIRRDSIKPMKSFDESLSKYHSKDKEIYESPKDETSSRETFGDSSNLDCSMKSPSFMQASSDESSMELKEIFVNKDSNNKVEFKLNGIIGTKSAISNCKGSKVTLEFYCGKNITRDKSEKIAEAKETSKFIKSGSKIDSSGLDAPEAITIQTDLTEVNKPSEGLESVSDLPHLKPVMRSQDDSKKVHLPTRIRPSPGLAKRIEESKAEVLQEAKLPADKPLPATNSEGIFSTRACSGFIKNDEMPVTSQNSISTEPKTEEKKKPSTAKALDFCNEDIESSLNEIRSILYGSRIGLAKTATQSMNSSQSITSYSKVHGVSNNFGINSLIQSVKKDLCTDINAPKDVLMPDAKMFCNSEEDNKADGAVKPEVSVIDELLEELRMSEPCFDDTQDVPQNSSPGVEMKGDLKYRHIDSHSGRAYIVNLSIPYAVEKKTFSLSPEATDCDSIDASSIISDEGKTSPSAMPVVEDGLSSEDEGREGFSEILRGNKTRKSFIIDSRSEHIPRVRKLEDKFFPTSSSGSISSVSASSSHSKQNGFSIKIKQQEKQVVRKDVKAKVKESSEMFAPHSENTKEQVDAKAVVKVERQETTKVDLFCFLVSSEKSTRTPTARTSLR